ncbi:threonine dehydratase [Crossiella equi]|uniref:Threonine dehydratase n=2 Tax=Crossiella equi TaxID=130796 RepID=A0ABS5AR77_9PSEU|nr:pyridoxal-phosphate dependent enzyme [Crossiella equi]MBP2479056.1 threonine dehydratase [Crossiella equi]
MTIPAPALSLGREDVLRAAERLTGEVRWTPLVRLTPGLLAKPEHLQHSGSFKFRGAVNAFHALRPSAVVCGSSGNHGIAVATLGARTGVPVTVVMAEDASPRKADLIHGLGAAVVRVPGGVAERDRQARKIAQRCGALLLPSSDHELVVAGAGTVALEVLAEQPRVETLFVPVGGGGLLAGSCLAAHGQGVRVVGVEPAEAPRYARSLALGRPVLVPPCLTIADGLRGQRPGEVILPIVRQCVDDLVTVTDEEVLDALELLRHHGIPAEPSGAVALAGALRTGWTGLATAVVSGGNTTTRKAVR